MARARGEKGKRRKGGIDGLERAALFFNSRYSEHIKIYQEVPMSFWASKEMAIFKSSLSISLQNYFFIEICGIITFTR
jgi:hypothetical protein